MTTIKDQITEKEVAYEPTVSDKINRILYRLDQGEELACGNLKEKNHFCVLGLFADESGLGRWREYGGNANCSGYDVDDRDDFMGELFVLPDAVVDYYGLTNNFTTFNCYDLKDPDLIDTLVQYDLVYSDGTTSLPRINDGLIRIGKAAEVNGILMKIIKSGVIFKA